MFFSEKICNHNDCHSMDLFLEDFKGSAPPVTFSQDETYNHNLLPRIGVGIAKCKDTGNKELVCVAVDEWNLERALGLTLRGTLDLLRLLGCTTAMIFDGGLSKWMVILDLTLKVHHVVCLNTTKIKAGGVYRDTCDNGLDNLERSRPVHSAILFLPHERLSDLNNCALFNDGSLII